MFFLFFKKKVIPLYCDYCLIKKLFYMTEKKELKEYVEYLNQRYSNKYVKIFKTDNPENVSYQYIDYINEYNSCTINDNKIVFNHKWCCDFIENTFDFNNFFIGSFYYMDELKNKVWTIEILTPDECQNLMKKRFENFNLFK